MPDFPSVLTSLQAATDPFLPASAPRLVRSSDGTERQDLNLHVEGALPFTSDDEARVDGLFGDSVAYVRIKREKPLHRLILWMMVNGHKPIEIAAALRITPQTVRNVQGQPWFQEAFCKVTSELGKDSVETFLQAQVLPTLQKLVDLRDGKDTPAAVQKSACDAILDRIRGKPTVHVKQESLGKVDVVVHDVAALLEEQKRNEQILSSRGIGKN